jgi:hypothetical protein
MSWLILAACSAGLDPIVPDERADTGTPVGGDTELDTSDTDRVDSGLGKPGKDDTGKDTDTEPPDEDKPPIIPAFSASEEETKVRFIFVVEDPNDDMGGGKVEISVDGTKQSWAYPGGVQWSDGGTAFVVWDLEDFPPEKATTCRMIATDYTGLESEPVTTTFTRSAWTTEITEAGDRPADAVGIGRVDPPGTINGNMYATGNDGYNFTADIDYVKFRLARSGTFSFTLSWDEASGDYDLYLMDADLNVINSAATYDFPEELGATLDADTDYYVAVAGWDGPGGNYSIRIE